MVGRVDGGDTATRAVTGRLAGFDGLRGLAAVGVLVLHSTNFALAAHFRAHSVTAQLQSGVQIFFVLSAFLLARPYVRAVLRGVPLPGLREFARNRLLRVVPAYWVAFVGMVLFLGPTQIHGVHDWLVHLSLTQVYWIDEVGRGIAVAWTLSVEVTFYLILPFFFMAVALLARRVAPLVALAIGTAALFVGGVAFMVWTAVTNRFLESFWLPFYLPVFACGIALAILREATVDERLRVRLSVFARRGALPAWLLAGAILLGAAWRFGPYVLIPYRAHLLGSQLAYDAYALLVVLPLVIDFDGASVVTRLMQRRAVVYLGLVSYPLYLWHDQLVGYSRDHWLHLGDAPGDPFVQFAVVTAAALVIATASWYGLERPILTWSRRRGVPRGRRPAPDAGNGDRPSRDPAPAALSGG